MIIIIDSGKLNEIVRFTKVETIKTSFGETKTQEVDKFKCRASVREQYLKEKTATIGTIYEGTVSIGIRNQLAKQIEMNWNLYLDNKKYRIIEIVPSRKNKYLAIIYAKKVS